MRYRLWLGAVVVSSVLLGGCASGPTHPALVGGALPELVPVRDFVASRQSKGGYRVSPDGQRIAWFGTDGVVPAIWVKSMDGADAKAFRIRARSFRFSADSRWIAITADPTGDENTRIHAGRVEGPDTGLRELMPAPRTASQLAETVEGSSDFIVTSNQRDKKVFDLYRVSPDGGAPTLLATNPGNVVWWGVDRAGRLLARSGEPIGWTLLRGDKRWEGVPPGSITANSPELLIRFARAGAGITAVPDYFASPYVRRGELQRVLPEWCPPSITAWAVFPGRKLMPAKTRAFLDMLQAAFAA